MHIWSSVLAAILVSSTVGVAAQEPGVLLSLKVSKNGEQVASPKLWSQFGATSSMSLGRTLLVEVSATDLGEAADLKFKLSSPENGVLVVSAQPRIHARFAEVSAIEFTANDGAEYRINVTPTKSSRPF